MSSVRPAVGAEPTPPVRAPLRRVLVATDFSAGSERGWMRALTLPVGPGGNIHVVHVLPALERRATRVDRLLEDFSAREFKRIVFAMERSLARQRRSDVEVTSEILRGTAYAEIVSCAVSRRSELIVIGRIGRQGLRHFLLGSTAERVVWSSAVPVLVAQAARPRAYRKMLAAFDDSVAAHAALRAGVRLGGGGERVDVVHALDLGHLLVAKNYGLSLRRVHALAEADARKVQEKLDRTLEQIGAGNLDVRLVVRHGAASGAILEEMRKRRPDLMMLGTRGRGSLQRTVLGSVAETVVRRATCDVLIARGPTR